MTQQYVSTPQNAVVLKNRGIPAEFYVLKKDAAGEYVRPYERVFDEVTEEPLLERRWIRFTNSVVATMEEEAPVGWGSLENWQQATQDSSFSTVCRTVAIVFDLWTVDKDGLPIPDKRLAGELMVDGAITQYLVACTYSVLIAQGMDPTKVGDSMKRSLRELAETISEMGVESREEVLVEISTEGVAEVVTLGATG